MTNFFVLSTAVVKFEGIRATTVKGMAVNQRFDYSNSTTVSGKLRVQLQIHIVLMFPFRHYCKPLVSEMLPSFHGFYERFSHG